MSAQVQYLRALSLKLGDPLGNALEFSSFRVSFQVRRGDLQTPNSADIRIYNLSDATAQLVQTEFIQVQLNAGYPGNIGLIFQGIIKQIRRGRVDQKDSYLDITCADGDEAYNYGTMALSAAAGTQTRAVAVEAIIQSMAQAAVQQSLSQGYTPQLSGNTNVRGRIYYGMSRDELREFADNNSLIWSIQDGQVTLIPKTGFIPSAPTVLSAQTGLIGVPEQTQNGVSARVLLNPNIKVGTRVQILGVVNQYRYGLDVPSQALNQVTSKILDTQGAAAGMYYVMRMDHTGDTRGQPWYTDLTCLAVDSTIPISGADQWSVNPAAGPIKPY